MGRPGSKHCRSFGLEEQESVERRGSTENTTLASEDRGLVHDGEGFLKKTEGSVLVEQLGYDKKNKRP